MSKALAESKFNTLKLYNIDKKILGCLTLDTDRKIDPCEIETIIILDISGSMGDNVGRILTYYLPLALHKLNIFRIMLITFGSSANIYNYSLNDLALSKIRSSGVTNMSPALSCLTKIISESSKKFFQILTISDGDISDMSKCAIEADILNLSLRKDPSKIISSRGLRFITSPSQPDTKALSTLLRLSTYESNFSTDLVDINYKDNKDAIDACFFNLLNYSFHACILKTSHRVTTSPWENSLKNEIYLSKGRNLFWMDTLPDYILLDDGNVNIIDVPEFSTLTHHVYNEIFYEKANYYMSRIKLARVVNSTDSLAEVKSILDYFAQVESSIIVDTGYDFHAGNIRSRLSHLKVAARKQKYSLSFKLSQIANDDKVQLVNSAQQASYLRTATLSQNSKQLAKRAIKSGLNFDEISQLEVLKIKQNISELDGIDDTDHYKSFCSQSSTLEALKALAELSQEDIEDFSAKQILSLLNLVGVGCRGVIGDYPDPKTYHQESIQYSSYVSMSDVIIGKDMGYTLTDPYDKLPVTNVVPIYNDNRIQNFLMKYAPNLLEYTASLGMRNMIVNIPHSYKYNIVGALWETAIYINKNGITEMLKDIFINLTETFSVAVDGLFDYMDSVIVDQPEEDIEKGLLYFISNNGITNMIYPIIKILKENKPEKVKQLPFIMRSLYSFEFYTVVRKFNRSDSDKIAARKQLLDSLLNISSEYETPLLTLFQETEPVPIFTRQNNNTLNSESFLKGQSIVKKVWWVDALATLVDLLRGTSGTKPEELLQLKDMSLYEFKLNCVIEGLLFDSQESRVADTKMKIIDPANKFHMDIMLGDYIESCYKEIYEKKSQERLKEEKDILIKCLVKELLDTTSIERFVSLLKCGLTRNGATVQINDQFSDGMQELQKGLLECGIPHDADLHIEKLRILLLGNYKSAIVWNSGNVLRILPSTLSRMLEKLEMTHFYEEIKDEYITRNVHLYRKSNKENRHTHNNDKISYWSMGFKTLGDFLQNVSENERKDYLRIHTHCCGIWDGKPVKLC